MTIYELCLLHSRADRALRTVVAEQLESVQLTMMQWLLLGSLVGSPKDGLSMSDIALKLGITLPQVTALLSDLTSRKLVKLKTQRRDRRSRHAILTSGGNDFLKKGEQAVESKLNELFPGERRLAYAGMLEHIIPGETESVLVDVTMEKSKEETL